MAKPKSVTNDDRIVHFVVPPELLRRVDKAIEAGQIEHGWTSRSAFFRAASAKLARDILQRADRDRGGV